MCGKETVQVLRAVIDINHRNQNVHLTLVSFLECPIYSQPPLEASHSIVRQIQLLYIVPTILSKSFLFHIQSLVLILSPRSVQSKLVSTSVCWHFVYQRKFSFLLQGAPPWLPWRLKKAGEILSKDLVGLCQCRISPSHVMSVTISKGHQRNGFNIICVIYNGFNSRLTGAICKDHLHTGEPEDPVDSQSPGAHCRVWHESVKES